MEDEEDEESEYYDSYYSYDTQYDSYDSYDDYESDDDYDEEDEDEDEDFSHWEDLCEHCHYVGDCRKYNLDKRGKVVGRSRRHDFPYGRRWRPGRENF